MTIDGHTCLKHVHYDLAWYGIRPIFMGLEPVLFNSPEFRSFQDDLGVKELPEAKAIQPHDPTSYRRRRSHGGSVLGFVPKPPSLHLGVSTLT